MSLHEFEEAARNGELSPFAWVQNPTLTGPGFQQAREIPLFASLYDPSRLHFQRHFQLARLPLVTGIVTGACVLLFWWALRQAEGMPTREVLLALGAKSSAHLIEGGQSWRLLVANLLHRDLTHLLLNLFGLLFAGAVMEGVYRRGDYLLLLTCSGVSTMALSAWWSDAVTVGASGLVFGCLGASLAFTLRYGRWLPRRYRLYFAFAAVLYAFGMLGMGFFSPRTDNVGHIGGFVCGGALGSVLVPRLLRLRALEEERRALLRPYLWALLVAVLTIFPLGWLLRQASLADGTLRLAALGVAWSQPSSWRKRSEELGFVTYGNGVDAFASFGCLPRAKTSAGTNLRREDLERLEAQLAALARAPSVREVRLGEWRAGVMGLASAPLPSMHMPVHCDTEEGLLSAEAWAFAHGSLQCMALLASYPSATPRARAALAAIPASLRLRHAPRHPPRVPPLRASAPP